MTHKKPSPLVGEGVNRQVDGRGKLEQKGQKVSYRMVLNTCLSFLNEVMTSEPFFEERSDAVKMSETPYPTNGSGKNLAKNTGIKCSNLCTHTCPFRLALLGTSRPKAKRLIAFSRRYAPKNAIRLPPRSGEANN